MSGSEPPSHPIIDDQAAQRLLQLLKEARKKLRTAPDDAERLLDGCIRVLEDDKKTIESAPTDPGRPKRTLLVPDGDTVVEPDKATEDLE